MLPVSKLSSCMEKNIKQIIVDKITRRRIHEHLVNPNDMISNEDIMNAKTELTVAVEDEGSSVDED